MNHHECLYQTRLLMSEIETSVSNLTEYFADRESMPSLFYDGYADAALIREKIDELRMNLRLAYYSIADEWNNIIVNDVRLHEVGKYIKFYRRLRMYCKDFHETIKESFKKVRWILSDTEIIDSYIEMFREMDDDMVVILDFFENADLTILPHNQRLEGLAKQMKRYVAEVDDEFYESLILKGRIPATKVKWLGKRNEASLFAIHFGLNDYQMNSAFIFRCHTKVYRPLKISSDKPTNAYETYDIYKILKDYDGGIKK